MISVRTIALPRKAESGTPDTRRSTVFGRQTFQQFPLAIRARGYCNPVASRVALWFNRLTPRRNIDVPSSKFLDADAVAEHIRGTGARATPARIRVLRLLRAAPAALTHNEIEQALGAATMDRVTLYRVLDWLAATGLVHKNPDASRVFRFSAAAAGEHKAHIHFRCEDCGGVFCLEAAPPAAPVLPSGFSLSRIDFDLRGRCADCCMPRVMSTARTPGG